MGMNNTTGSQVAAELRRYLSIGTTTRRWRNGDDLLVRMVETIEQVAFQPGYHTERTETALHPAAGAAMAYRKHIDGYRVDGTTIAYIKGLSPWRFAGFIGEMVDAGVTNTGDGERFFRTVTA